MIFLCMQQGLVKSGSFRGSVGKRRRPRPINRHTSSSLGPWPRLKAKPEHALGPGATVDVLGMGSPNLPACGPRRGSTSGPVRPIFINQHSRPSRGAKPRGADNVELPQARPHQVGSRGGGEIKARGTSRGSRDASHADQGQAGANACSVLVSPLVLRGQTQARSTEASSKGCHIGATRSRPGGRQGGGHRGAQDCVTLELFAGEDRFCQDSLY